MNDKMINRDYKAEFDNLIKEVISPIFKKLGFKKKTNYFYKVNSDIIQVFNVQKSRWNSNEDISFTFNIGFFNGEIYKESYNRPAPEYPKEYDCFISFPSEIVTHKNNWYRLNSTVNFDVLITGIETDIEESVIKLFEKYQTLDSLINLIGEYPVLKESFKTIARFIFLMKINLKQEAANFIISEYKNAIIPKPNISIVVYPDGRRVETQSEPKINQEYIDSLKKIATVYNIEIE